MPNPPIKDNEAIISLGGNWGPTELYFTNALKAISQFATIIKQTPITQTAPVGYNNQPAFFNQLIQISTDLPPHNLLHKLQTVEQSLLRKRLIKMGPRPIDLDIIYYGNQKINTKELTLPHPATNNRQYLIDLLQTLFK